MTNTKIWVDWDGRDDVIKRAEIPASSYLEASRLPAIGRSDSRNVLIWDNAVSGVKFVEQLTKRKISCAYVNIRNALTGPCSEAEMMSALLEVLLHIRMQMTSECIVIVRSVPELMDEMTVLLKNVFSETHYVSHASILRGYEGFTELSVACPIDGQFNPRFFQWRRWNDMFKDCCKLNGLTLIAGFDEAICGCLDYGRINDIKPMVALVSPLERVVSSCSNSIQHAVEAWNLLQATASHEASYFDGVSVYEIVPLAARFAGPQ